MTLRNTPGGMAWVRCLQGACGFEALYGQVVRTDRADPDNFWYFSPPLTFLVTQDFESANGKSARRGQVVQVSRLHDDVLEPIRDVGDDERSQEKDFQQTLPAQEVV